MQRLHGQGRAGTSTVILIVWASPVVVTCDRVYGQALLLSHVTEYNGSQLWAVPPSIAPATWSSMIVYFERHYQYVSS